jgi:hypothetical protein
MVNNYTITPENKITEGNIIRQIAHENGYNNSIQKQNKNKINSKMEIANEDNNQEGKKWATFTYTGSETKFITKLFKNTNLKIAYKTSNTIG